MKTLIKILCLSVLWFSCESSTEPQNNHGCLDFQACNYNPNATIDNNSCLYFDECGECGGNNSTCIDECGIPYGDNSSCTDVCGIINGPGYDCGGGCDENVLISGECYNIETTTELNLQCFGSINLDGIDKLINLEILRFHSGCTGSIPPEIGNLTSLKSFGVQHANLEGTIPNEIGNLTRLEYFSLYNAGDITGEIPTEFWSLTNLKQISLININVYGQLPSEIGNLSNLIHLSIIDTWMSGVIPEEIGNLTDLEILDFNSNYFSGEVPSSMINLTNLSILDLSYNSELTGTLISFLPNNADHIDLSRCNFMGALSPGLFNNNAYHFDIEWNQLSGIIPENICNTSPTEVGFNKFCPPYPDCIYQSDIDSQDTSNCP